MNYYLNQKILYSTMLFGKQYYWMQDGDGTVYLAHINEDGTPDFA